ncbi:MAG: hypothetical protein U5L09_11535 [Bacteroidales bacterium]|nr:hypothetical protein [Bacteroidales bacterium]
MTARPEKHHIAVDTDHQPKGNYKKGVARFTAIIMWLIGQKGSTVAQVAKTLQENGAMDYTGQP